MGKIIFVSMFMLFMSSSIFSQAGMNIYAGPFVMATQDQNFTPKGEYHSGYLVGLHGRLNSDNLYFLLSGEYGLTNIVSNKEIKIFGDKDLTFFKFKVGLGLDILKLSENAGIRVKGQGVLLSVSKLDETLLNIPRFRDDYKDVNDGTVGVATGVGVFLGPLTFDINYEIGFLNFVKEKPDTNLNFLDLVVGLRF
jgi:hypothetical protein